MKNLVAVFVLSLVFGASFASAQNGAKNLLTENQTIVDTYMSRHGYYIDKNGCLADRTDTCLINYPKLVVILESYVRTMKGETDGEGYNNLGTQMGIFYAQMTEDKTWDSASSLVILIATDPKFVSSSDLYIYKN